MFAQFYGVGELDRVARQRPRDQLHVGVGGGVEVGFAAEVFDQVDDDVDAAAIGDRQVFGSDADGDLFQAGVVQQGELVALEFQRGILTDLDAW